MGIISLKTAKALKEAGLELEAKKGDWYWAFGTNSIELIAVDRVSITPRNIVFLPRLDQLLVEIEKQGYIVETGGPYNSDDGKPYLCCFNSPQYDSTCCESFWGEMRKEAAAEALLWILHNQGSDDACESE